MDYPYVVRPRARRNKDRGLESAEIAIGLLEGGFLSTAQWFPAPDAGMSASRPRWGSTQQTITGGYIQQASPYGGKVISMSWSLLNPFHVEFLEDLVTRSIAVEGSRILIQFPYHRNCASPMLARPENLLYAYSPAVWTSLGQKVATRLEPHGLSFKPESRDTPDYDEYYIVPPGYALTAATSVSTGGRIEFWQQTGDRSVGFNKLTANSLLSMTNNTRDFRVAFIRVGAGRAAGDVGPIGAQLRRIEKPPSVSPSIPAMGTSSLAVVPESFTIQEHSGPRGWLSASLEFQEMFPWV